MKNMNTIQFKKEVKNICEFLQQMDNSEFVSIHQENLKDHYLTKPRYDTSEIEEFCWDYGFFEIIQEKYIEFFKELDFEESYKWLNPKAGLVGSMSENWSDYLKSEDFTKEEVADIICQNEISDDTNDLLNDLYYETFSGFGYSWFLIDIIDKYNSSK